jgi:uncharacterized protein YlxW (UPF0749 family)
VTSDPSPQDPAPDQRSRRPGWLAGFRGQLLVAALCAALGFAIVTQVRQTQQDDLSTLRQDDLVRLLDEITQRNEALTAEGDQLRSERSELLSGADATRSAEEYLQNQAVMAGTQPVEGPGVVLAVSEAGGVSAQVLVHVLEELRNAGAESIELSGVRLVASSSFVDTDDGVMVDGALLGDEQEWRVIGDPGTIAGALEIPGGALTSLRTDFAQVRVTERPLVQITAIREVSEPEYAVPVTDGG